MCIKGIKKIVWIIVVLSMIFSLVACGGNKEKGAELASNDDPNVGMWNAVIIELRGETIEINDMYREGISLELNSNGKYVLIWDGAKNKGQWNFKDGILTVEREDEDLVGPIENGILKIINALDLGMDITFEKEGGPEVASVADIISSQLYPDGVELGEAQQWWDGDWYGYWETHSETDIYTDFEGGRWECFGLIQMQPDDTGSIYLWDPEDDFAMANITVNEYGGSGDMGAAVSESGHLWFDEEITHGDWIIDPSLYGYENYMVIDGRYEDEFGGGFNYIIHLRPWGESWDENPEEERPPWHDTWYLSAYQAATMWEAIEDRGAHIHSELGDIIVDVDPEEMETVVTEDPTPIETISSEPVEVIFDLTRIGLKVSVMLPEQGWFSKNSSDTVWINNVPKLEDIYSNSPLIKIYSRDNVEAFDFYIADFENLKTIENRTIDGIDMKGRTYKNVGMDWVEYVGVADTGHAVSILISKIDVSSGEGKAVLDSIKFK